MAELLNRMSSRELSEWMAKDRIRPPQDGYWQTGLLASLMVNLWGSGKRRYKPTDFMPRRADRDGPEEPQSADQGKAIMEGMVKALNRRRTSRV